MLNLQYPAVLATLALVLLSGCHSRDDSGVDLKLRPVRNQLANIPPQCFTRTRDDSGKVQNPCYVCHADADEPNFQSQPENQLSYAFPSLQRTGKVRNEWRNFFVDRAPAIAAITNDDILRYVRHDNYRDARGRIDLATRLARVPQNWDVDGDGRWGGYVPDAAFNFDAEGFDRAADGRATGWRAFAYVPFPGSFMPTNGAFDDVLIRLPAPFREREDGTPDERVYAINLAIVESLVRRADIAIDAIDEKTLGVDLDRDGALATATATRVVYDWAPLQQRFSHTSAAHAANRMPAACTPLPACSPRAPSSCTACAISMSPPTAA